MNRTTWKTVMIEDGHDWHELLSFRAAAREEFRGYTVRTEDAPQIIETNIPWALLRWWFSRAGVSMPDVLATKAPSWEAAR